ncbi:hypothetical protein LX16_0905 [Stackebrandtia albiflava]|uniref:Uncharacterized protein n=1 Tax=Stackebrandtia albiflava TaxID=406432 RepID=A0A562VBE4_9ACTN|nr:hypothetical protein [Stackebrandtia albiflava]TWJ15205.1 hypothetical protein LX16_0905 [Stackebrandtia albiflava]
MPETRKPGTPRGVPTRVPAWLRNSDLATVTHRLYRTVRASALLATVISFLRQTAGRVGRRIESAYRTTAPRIISLVHRILKTTPAVRTIRFGGRTASAVRGHATTAANSRIVRQLSARGDHALTTVRNSALGQATGRGVATVRRHLPDWAVARLDGDGKSAWRVAVADSDAGLLWRAAAAIGVVAVISLGLMGSPVESNNGSVAATAGAPAERSVEDQAGRSDDRTAPEEGDAPAPADEPVPAEPETEPEAETAPEPVGGLSEDQMANAVEIVEIGEEMGISEKGQAVALATAMQESQLLVLANTGMPASLDEDHQGTGFDHDSVGLFQQRPSSGWGTIAECMDVEHSTTSFYNALKRVDGWSGMDLTVAAQTVQGSAFPDAYAKWEDLAWDIIDATK